MENQTTQQNEETGELVMFTIKTLAGAMVALGLTASLPGAVLAAAPQEHESHGASAVELTLNNGQKWQTGETLRMGMSQIRDALGATLPLIHSGRYSAADLSTLGTWVQEQVDFVVANCKLPEEADLQLHIALTQVLDGINVIMGPGGQEKSAVAIIQALNAYGEHFDHPGWKPLGD
jgi:hypothetical protein